MSSADLMKWVRDTLQRHLGEIDEMTIMTITISIILASFSKSNSRQHHSMHACTCASVDGAFVSDTIGNYNVVVQCLEW